MFLSHPGGFRHPSLTAQSTPSYPHSTRCCPNYWVAAKELKVSYDNSETRLFAMYPYSGTLNWTLQPPGDLLYQLRRRSSILRFQQIMTAKIDIYGYYHKSLQQEPYQLGSVTGDHDCRDVNILSQRPRRKISALGKRTAPAALTILCLPENPLPSWC